MRAVHVIRGSRGVALVGVLFATVLLLALVTVLVDVGTLRLQRATAGVFAIQALGGADAGTAWVRALLDAERGDIDATVTKLGRTQGRRRFTVDGETYVVATETILDVSQPHDDDHVDELVQGNPRAEERVIQVDSSAAVYANGAVVARRDTSVLLRVFPVTPYSEVVGYVDDASAVGIDSPGDAAGQQRALDTTDLLVHAYTMDQLTQPQNADHFQEYTWSDGNSTGPGPLP